MADQPTVTLYDLLDALIERVPWRTEGEMLQYKNLVTELRDRNLFGYMADRIAVEKQDTRDPKSVAMRVRDERRRYA